MLMSEMGVEIYVKFFKVYFKDLMEVLFRLFYIKR